MRPVTAPEDRAGRAKGSGAVIPAGVQGAEPPLGAFLGTFLPPILCNGTRVFVSTKM